MMGVLLLWVLACAFQDLRQRHISNRLLYPLMLLAAAWLPATSQSLAGASISSALTGAALALALTIPGHIKGVLGGGDVKLMAAVGLCTGAMATLVLTALAALWLVVWALAMARLPTRACGWLQRHAPGLVIQRGQFAYGPFVFLALGSLQLLALLYGA
ncbi:prepilin peptidase [Halomonas aquamarina]|uniref:Prepilin peptidase n=1 Tax=Vreelandella aquamarina TaxID=77097 RepID=A0ACC5VTR2_9GAMM|nr:prepilin peptidase [Halomonas aquamarina]MBZ5487047.1 prepilin peptidase [Halomonas aquamarina]